MVFDMLCIGLPDWFLARPGKLAVSGRAWMEPSAKKTTKMKALTYWDPFRELEDMQHRLSTVLGRQLNRRQDGDKESITVAHKAHECAFAE
jgi:hypothetical protein